MNYNYNEIKRQPIADIRSKSPGIVISPHKANDYKSTPLKTPAIAASRPMSSKIAQPIKRTIEQPDKILINPIKIGGCKIPGYQNNNFLRANSRPTGDRGVVRVLSNNDQKVINIYKK
jgi:hypothetical protein